MRFVKKEPNVGRNFLLNDGKIENLFAHTSPPITEKL